MKQDVLKQAALFSKEHRRRTRRHKVFSVLAAIMVFCTTYALIMPAITLEHEALPVCGLEEHTHTEACYGEPELVCGLEETDGEGHVHTDACYETVETEREVLTCELPEGEGHVHTDACYAEPPATTGTELICELEEGEDHTHSDECYAPVEADGERVLACGLEECEPHTHGEGCYTTEVVEEKTLTCDLEEAAAHTHTEECYERPLICGLEEHTHTEECYTEEISDGEVPEGEVPEEPFVELERTVESRYYKALFHVTYHGELAEEDVLDFTASTDEDFGDERGAEYYGAVDASTTLPGGRTEFVLTNNGEAVDRALYDVTVEIIPSREMVAGLYQWSAEMMMPDTMDLTAEDYESEPVESAEPVADVAEPVVDETEPVADEAEPEGHTHSSEPFVGFMAYELEDGALALRGAMPFDVTAIEDIAAYMTVYDEEGNPLPLYDEEDNPIPSYDETYAFNIQPLEQDFMFAAGVAENPIEELAHLDQRAWNANRPVYWNGYYTIDYGKNTYYYPTSNHHISSVTLTHSDSSGQKDTQATAPTTVPYEASNASKWTVGNAYPNASKDTGNFVVCSKEEATHLQYSRYGYWSDYCAKGSNSWKYYVDSEYVRFYKYSKGLDYALLEIEPASGYYVKQVIILCDTDHKSAGSTSYYGCTVLSGDNGVFTKTFGVGEGTKVSLTVPSDAFCHTNSGYESSDSNGTENYYILIRTAPIPSPLFVSYEYGNIEQMGLTREQMSTFTSGNAWLAPNGETNRNTAAGNNVLNATTVDQLRKMKSTENWSTGELDYYVSNISPEAEAAANAHGWRFTGWRLEYWGDVTENITGAYTDATQVQNVAGQFPQFDTTNNQNNLDNGFAGSRTISANELKTAEGRKKNLMTNAKLIAQWEPIPVAEVVKTVENTTDTTSNFKGRTFEFKIENAAVKNTSFVVKTNEYKTENGVTRPTGGKVDTQVTFDEKGVATFTITVYGNGEESAELSGLTPGTYKVTEVVPEDAEYKPYYTTDQTFTVISGSGDQHLKVAVTNDYAPAYEVIIEKVTTKVTTEDIQNTDPPLSATPNDPNAKWKALGGAKFNLYAGTAVKNTAGNVTKYDWEKVNKDTVNADGSKTPNPIEPKETGNGAKVKQGSLSYGVYYMLEEVTAPPGYNKLTKPIYFKAERDGGLKLYTLNADETTFTEVQGNGDRNSHAVMAGNVMSLIVANYGGFELPSTGGPGTYVYALGGMLLAAAAAILMYKSTRRREGGLTD